MQTLQPLTIYETHFRSAEAMLKVYRLLDSSLTPVQQEALVPRVREILGCEAEEPLILLLNDLFMGTVRQRAEVHPAFFTRQSISLLLRQAVVSACTALDVFVPSLLHAHLPPVVRIRQRNFLPIAGEVRDFFRDFSLKLEEVVPLLEEDNSADRWDALTVRILAHTDRKTLSNVQGISAVMLMLGVDEPWRQIAARAGMSEQSLREQISTIVSRRNAIVHRGDRPVGVMEGPAEAIDYAWTRSQLNAVDSVVQSRNALAAEAVSELTLQAGAA